MYMRPPRKVPDNPVADLAVGVILIVGCVGSVLWGLGGYSGSSLRGRLGLGVLLVAVAAGVVFLIANITGWGDRTEYKLDITVSRDEAVTTLHLAGDLNELTRQVLREKIRELVGQGTRNLVVNIDRVEDFDSTGLGTLVGGLKRVRQEGGQLTVVCNLSKVFGLADPRDRR